MLDDSFQTALVDAQPLPAFLALPRENRVLHANKAARDLFDLSDRLSDVVLSPATEVAVFLDAVEHFGRYVDRSLTLRGATERQLRLQSYGMQLSRTEVLLCFLDLDDLERRNQQMELDAHHKGGLMQWQNIYGFFREVEAQNHLILEAAGEGIYGINAEGKATFVNRAAQEMLGWSADDLIGRDLHATIHHKHLNGEHFPAHKCPIYASFRKDQTMRVDDDVFWRKDGKPIMVEYVSTPIYDHNVLAGAVVIFRDVTERRENERKLRDALTQVEELKVKLEQENDYLLTEVRSARSHTGVVGVSAPIKLLNAQIDLAARNNTHVLVSGPPGSGKGLTVTAIHEASQRQRRPLVRINCSETNIQALESELLGHKRGAFPGASRDQTGKLLMAHNGTLHLDEVADLPTSLQAKLHEILRTGHFQRLGDTGHTPVSLTVIATTTRDLASEVRAGRFRQDLYFTLNLFSIQSVPLRDRTEDIPYLAKHFLDRTTRRLRLPQTRLTRSNIEALEQYAWPWNVRELEGGRLEFDFQPADPSPNPGPDIVLTANELNELERENLKNALRRTKGRVSGQQGAAKILGLAQTTVFSKLKSFGINPADFK